MARDSSYSRSGRTSQDKSRRSSRRTLEEDEKQTNRRSTTKDSGSIYDRISSRKPKDREEKAKSVSSRKDSRSRTTSRNKAEADRDEKSSSRYSSSTERNNRRSSSKPSTSRDRNDKSRQSAAPKAATSRERYKDNRRGSYSTASSKIRTSTSSKSDERTASPAEIGDEEASARASDPTPSSSRKHWDKENIATDLAEEPDEEIGVDVTNGHDEDVEEVDDYEDDFEDYDDDNFEEDIEDDDDDDEGGLNKSADPPPVPRQPSAYQRVRMDQEVEEVKKAMIRENSARPSRRTQEPQPEPEPEREYEASTRRQPSGRGYVNFNSAKERQKTQLAAGKVAKRGDKLLRMIRLDVVSFDLFELPPIRYEAFMKTFGSSNAAQATTQTGENNIDEESQTETIEQLHKWTQKPPAKVSGKDYEDPELLKQAIKGVGGQMREDRDSKSSWEFVDFTNSMRLSLFLGSASEAMLTLLEEESQQSIHEEEAMENEQKRVEFSENVTCLNTKLPFLAKRPVNLVEFAPDQASILLSVHGPASAPGESNTSLSNDFAKHSFLCLWNIFHPSTPHTIMRIHEKVSSCTFSPSKASVVFGGLEDGTISSWDLREQSATHQEVVKEEYEQDNFTFRSPTYVTSDGEGHFSRVNAVKCLPKPSEEENLTSEAEMQALQIVSLEEKGHIIIWTLLDFQKDFDQHLGLAHWGTLRIVQTLVIDIANTFTKDMPQPEMNTFDLEVNPSDGSQLFVSTETGLVLHASIHQGHRPTPRCYKPEFENISRSKSMAFFPFGEGYFLAGSDDGNIRLHITSNERPIISWPGTIDSQPVRKVLWSKSRPCVFIVLDSQSTVHIWDLGIGDIYPVHSVQFERHIKALAINPDLKGTVNSSQFLALGMEDGSIEVHHLLEDYQSEGEEQCQKELDRFLHYVSII